jgi:hypothetical protein
MPTTLPDLDVVLAALDPEELAIVTGGGWGTNIVEGARIGLVGASLLMPNSGLKAPSLPPRPIPIVQPIGVTQK